MSILLLLTLALGSQAGTEAEVVEYLKTHVKPGQPVVVSELYNTVFTQPAQRAVLDRLFNTFFKIPLFVAQHYKANGEPPRLSEIGEQFHFQVPGETEVMLRIMESDPRMPKFLKRDAATGEITRVDVEAILGHPRFGKSLERTIAGFEGREAPAFEVEGFDGRPLSSASLKDKPYLLYFWFTNCPPCLKTSPVLVKLDRTYRPQGLEIAGLNADRVLELPYDDEVRAEYASQVGIAFRQGHLTAAVQEAFGSVSVFPTIFVVDRRGVIVKHFVNAPPPEALESAVGLALK